MVVSGIDVVMVEMTVVMGMVAIGIGGGANCRGRGGGKRGAMGGEWPFSGRGV